MTPPLVGPYRDEIHNCEVSTTPPLQSDRGSHSRGYGVADCMRKPGLKSWEHLPAGKISGALNRLSQPRLRFCDSNSQITCHLEASMLR